MEKLPIVQIVLFSKGHIYWRYTCSLENIFFIIFFVAVCVYNGVPLRQGMTIDVGCDKVCKCEDAMTQQVTCTDR